MAGQADQELAEGAGGADPLQGADAVDDDPFGAEQFDLTADVDLMTLSLVWLQCLSTLSTS